MGKSSFAVSLEQARTQLQLILEGVAPSKFSECVAHRLSKEGKRVGLTEKEIVLALLRPVAKSLREKGEGA